MKLPNRCWLQPTEYVCVTLYAVGTIAAAVTQQAIYATVPLTLALSLNINNTKRLQQQSAIATANQVKLNEQSNQDIDELRQTSQQLQQQFADFSLDRQSDLTLTLQAELKQSITDANKNIEQEFNTKIQDEIKVIQQDNEQKHQQNQNLEQAFEKLHLRYQIVGYLSSQIRELKQQKRQTNQQLNNLENKINLLNQTQQEISTNVDAIASSIKSNNSLNSHSTTYLLNGFEKVVATELKKHFSEQEILTHFDVGKSGDSSKCVDFALVLPNCIIIIEAKGYKGKIVAQGEPRNSRWMCRTGKQEIPINACWGENPYKQVKVYVDSFLQRLRSANAAMNNFPVYGVVVFPTAVEVDANIKNDIGGYYKVTTLDQLATTISSLKEEASFRNRSRLSYRNIIEILIGASAQNVA